MDNTKHLISKQDLLKAVSYFTARVFEEAHKLTGVPVSFMIVALKTLRPSDFFTEQLEQHKKNGMSVFDMIIQDVLENCFAVREALFPSMPIDTFIEIVSKQKDKLIIDLQEGSKMKEN